MWRSVIESISDLNAEVLLWQTLDPTKWAMINVHGVLNGRELAAASLPFCSACSNIV